MSSLSNSDIILPAVGLLSALWCMGLAVYVAISDSRAKASSLASTTAAFSTLLSNLGKQRRRDRSAP
jgi:hypothetical protein